MLKLKLQYFGLLMRRADSLEKTLILGKIEGKRRSRWQSMICLGSITDSMDMSLSKLGDSEGQGSLACCSPWGCRVRHDWATEQQMSFPVVMYGCESWTIKKAECQKINAFELCRRRFLRVPWTAWRSNQSILEETNPEYSLEGLIRKLKLQYFGHMMRRADSLKRPWCWERLKAKAGRSGRG